MSAEDGIGSVSVEVVPDAQRFWTRFRQQTRGQADAEGRREGEAWQRGFQASARQTEVTVRVNTKDARKDTNLLFDAIGSLAPALVPLAATAALGAGALVSLGVTGGLAIGGIKRDIKDANAEGLQFSAGLNVLEDDLHGLETTAAHGVLSVFREDVTRLHAEMPALNSDLAQSSQVLGSIAGHVLGAAVGGLHTFAPELLAIETQVDHLAGAFETWATGPGGERFAAGLAEDFNHVAPLLEHLSGAIAHVIASGNTPGLAIVDELDTLSKVLEAIPTPILTGMITTLAALKTASLVSGLMDKLAVSIRGVAVAEGEAAAASTARGGIAGAVGFIGKVGATYLGAALAIDAFAKATDSARTSTDGFDRIAAQTGHTLSLLVRGHFSDVAHYLFGGASKDDQTARENEELANSYRAMTGQVKFLGNAFRTQDRATEALNAHSLDLTQTLITGHAVWTKTTVAEDIAAEHTKELLRNTAALTSVFDQLHGAVGGGIAISQAVSGYADAEKAVQANIDTGEKFLKLGGETIDKYNGVTVTLDMYKAALAKTGSDAAAIGYIHAQIDALGQNQNALKELADESANVSTFVSDVGTKYKLTTQQIDVYTAALGINTAEIGKGGAALTSAENRLGQFVTTLKNGSTALDGWLAAVDQWTKSSDTVADRAQLIGAALKASNGDMLAYANTMVTAAQANQQLVTDFVNLKDGVVNLRRGTIDFHNAAAAPLLGDLQNLQTAAMNSAAAVYQHYTAVGDASAGDKAFKTYVEDTQGALIGQAGQLGITKGQAKKLADEYFGIKNSGDLKKQIELIGKDEVLGTLKSILEDLDIMAGKHFKSYLDIQTTLTNAPGVSGSRSARAAADGAIITEGTGPRADDVLIRVSKGEAVIPADQTSKHRGVVESLINRTYGYATGGIAGDPPNPFTGVDYSGNADKNGQTTRRHGSKPSVTYTVAGQDYSSLQAAENAAKRVFKAQVALGVKIDDKDLHSFRHALAGTVDQARAAFQTMYDDAKKLGISHKLADTLRAENSRLDAAINDRNKAKDRYKTVMDDFRQVRDSVTSAGEGAFDVTSAGTGFDGQQAVTFDSLEAQQTQAKNRVEAWAAGIRKLGKTFGKTKTGQQLLEQLASGGPSDYPEVKALLTATPKDLANFVATEHQINSTSAGLGNYVGGALYGGQLKSLQARIKIDDASIDRLADKIEHQMEKAVDKLADRPVKLYADGREIATVGASGAKKNARRK